MELTCRPARSHVPTVLLNQVTVQRPCSGGQVQRFVTRLISSTQFQIACVMSSEYLLFFIGTVDSYHMQPVLRFPLETNAVPLHWGGGQLAYATCTQVSFGDKCRPSSLGRWTADICNLYSGFLWAIEPPLFILESISPIRVFSEP
jgi:hypothetical protein